MGCQFWKKLGVVALCHFESNQQPVLRVMELVNSPGQTTSLTVFITRGPVTTPWLSRSSLKMVGNGGGCSPCSESTVYASVDPCIIPRHVNTELAAVSLSSHVLVSNICGSALNRLDRRHSFLTALICFDSVIEEQRLFGEPKRMIE